MTSLPSEPCEVDLQRVATARDIHVAFAAALGFPDWYGHNWDAFWDLISSDYPLPDRLTLRGLDHVERLLPAEAAKMLRCFGDYNNATGRGCALTVTDDYSTVLFFLQYEAHPAPRSKHVGLRGAMVNCWIKAPSTREAHARAVKSIEDEGWEIVSHQEVAPRTLSAATEGDRPFIEQACVDGAVFSFHTWSSEGDD